MASAAVKEDEHDLCCPVCSELFTQPKILTCGHVLCHHCLVSWMKKQPEAACPLCRCLIVDPKDRASGRSMEEVASSFLTDLGMETLVASHRLLSQDHECQACATQTATSICTTCRDLLCASCATIHTRMSVSRHHTVEQLSSMTAQRLASSHPSFCSTHADEICKVFCPTHGESICLLCATTDHRQCPDLSQLETKVEEARAELADMRAKLRTDEAHLSQAIQQLEQHLQDMKEQFQLTKAEIRAMCERLESSIKANEERLNNQLHRVYNDVEEAITEAKTYLNQRRGTLTVHGNIMERAEVGSRDTASGMSSGLKTKVSSLDSSSVLPPRAKVVSTFSLLIDQKAVARVEQEVAQLGQLKVVPADLLAQPAQAKVQPAQTKVQPAQATVQPAQAMVQPAQAMVQPAQAKVQPAQTTVQPAQATVQPAQAKVQPAQATVQPAQAKVQPAQAKIQPAQTKVQPAQAKPAALTFHDQKKGDNIVLSNNQQTAESRDYGNGIVLSSEPMEVNCLYQVRVEELHDLGCPALGVVTQPPDTVTLPRWSWHLTSAVVIRHDRVTVNGTARSSQVGSSLYEVREGGRVGLMLDKDITLHLYSDGRHLGQVEPHLPHPCYFMVELGAHWRKVTALPVQRMR